MATEPPRRRRHSRAVYVRRRVVLVVGILALIVALWLLIAQPWRGSASPTSGSGTGGTSADAGVTELPVPHATSGTPAATTTPTAAPSKTKAAVASPSASPAAAACRSGDIDVKPVTDKGAYATGQNPLLSISLTNNGDADCTLNVGTSAQVFTITSGTDTWWRSTDCQTEPSDMVVVLAAGQTVKSAAPLTWDRTRSSVSTCSSSGRPRAPGGGATYHLAVEIGGVSSTEDAQFLLY